MARQATASINLKANDYATAKINNLKRSLLSLSATARTAVGSMTGFGSVAGVTGLSMMAKNAIDAGSAISDMATATQTSIEELQVLTFAAREAGASNEQMANLLVRAQKSANDAARGLSTAKDAFAQLGINAETFIDLAPERKLEVLGQALVTAEGDTRAYGAALDLLGTRNAPKLMEVLQRLGTDGFDKMAKDAKDAGQVMAEEVSQSMDNISDEIGNFKNRLNNLFAEQIFIMTSELNTEIMTLQFLKVAVKFSKAVVSGMSEAIKFLTAGMQGVAAVFVESVKTGASIGLNSIKVATESIKLGLTTVFNDFITVLNSAMQSLAGMINKISFFDDVSAPQFGILSTENIIANLDEAKSGIRNAGFDLGETFMTAFSESFESSQLRPMDIFDTAIADLDFGIQTLKESILETGTETEQSFKRARTVIGETKETANTVEHSFDLMGNASRAFASGLENGLANAAANGKSAFADMAQFVLAEIQRILIRMLLFRTFMGLGFTGFAANFAPPPVAGTRPAGGSVQGGRRYIVGERGPEMITMGGNGYVTPNNQLGGPTFNVDMRGASLEAVQRLEQFVAAMNGSIEQRSVRAVQDAFSRQPTYMRR